jgi:hypothetical protein
LDRPLEGDEVCYELGFGCEDTDEDDDEEFDELFQYLHATWFMEDYAVCILGKFYDDNDEERHPFDPCFDISKVNFYPLDKDDENAIY